MTNTRGNSELYRHASTFQSFFFFKLANNTSIFVGKKKKRKKKLYMQMQGSDLYDDDDTMTKLKQEQYEIEAKMRELEEMEQQGLRNRKKPTSSESSVRKLSDNKMMLSTPPRAPEVKKIIEKVPEEIYQQFYDPMNYKSYHDVYAKNRERNLVPKPFSFEARERARKSQPATRSSRKEFDNHIRKQKQNQEICYPSGSRAPFTANVVPPSTFTKKYEQMVIETEERKLHFKQELDDKRLLLEADSHSIEARELYEKMISRPLREKDRYVP